MKNRLLYAFAAMSVLALTCGCEQTKVVDVPAPQPVIKPFTFTAVAGVDTRVDAAFGSNQNTINFTWSEGDCISVCFIKAEELAALDSDVHEFDGETYSFELKSGAGTSKAVFQSVDMNPSDVLEPGVEYIMNAVYNPAGKDGRERIWDICGNRIRSFRWVNQQQTYNPAEPLGNVSAMDMLGAYPLSVYQDSEPELQFEHGITVYRIKISNIGVDPLTVTSIEYPTNEADSYGPEYSTAFDVTADAGKVSGRNFGATGSQDNEAHGLLTVSSPVTIASGETVTVYIPMVPCFVNTTDIPKTHIVSLSNGKTIRVVKNPPVGFEFCAGHMYTTTLSIRSEMATDESEIPPITGGSTDDF